MLIIDDCADYIGNRCPKYAFIHQNGRVLHNTFQDQLLVSLIEKASFFFNNIPVQRYLHKGPMYVYRPTENVILIITSRESEEDIEPIFDAFQRRYGLLLAKKYSTDSKSLNDLFEYAIFSCARKMGPEPIAYITKAELSEDKVFSVSLTSMMVLVGEFEGAKERILNFHPFIKDHKLGVIYLFQIPLKQARGNAFDSTILLMTDLGNRASVYNFHIVLERFLSICADKITAEFQQQMENTDIHGPIPDKNEFVGCLKALYKDLDSILIESKSNEETQADMFEALNSLKEP